MSKIINKKGVTLVILAVTIIVALILLTTIIFSYDNIKNSIKKREFAKEIYAIQKLSDEYILKNGNIPIKSQSPYIFLSEAVTSYPEQFQDEEENNLCYELDLSKINVESVTKGIKKDGDENDIYVISEKTKRIYYLKGYEIGDMTYYTLTEELSNLLR